MLDQTVLVVEEEYLIAAEIEATLLAKGASKVLIARDTHEASLLTTQVDIAIIEAKLGAPASIEFAASLRRAGAAVVVTSADRAVTSLFAGCAPLEKPFDDAALLTACEAALRLAKPVTQL